MARTIATARALCTGRLTVVFGAGGNRDQPKRPLMGRAATGADRILVTNDNPRDEDPMAIASAVRAGASDHPHAEILLDRAVAIRTAIREAGPDDVVLVAGKGHETTQQLGRNVLPFSDRDVIKAALAEVR
jgi:UDP-N-acetylmuramoyl-L-alanyl-D-glutamate--2,6-diaminopimelate ligase